MGPKKNILMVGIHRDISYMIQGAIESGIGQSIQMNFQTEDALCVEKIPTLQDCYQILVIHHTKGEELSSQLSFLRMYNFRMKIILLSDHEADYYMLQKYNIAFVIRRSHLNEDLLNLSFVLKESFQNRQFYLPHQQRFLYIHNIYYIESNKNYIQINSAEGIFKERFTIKELANHQAFGLFLMVSQSILVHPLHVKHIKHEKVIMRNGKELFISRGKLHQVYQKLEDIRQYITLTI